MLRGYLGIALLLAGCASTSATHQTDAHRLRGTMVDAAGRVLATSFAAPRGEPNRAYPYGGLTAHAVGYVARPETPGDSRSWIGRSAAERGFDQELAAGHEVALTLEVPLQKAARRALAGHRAGAIVAMEPATGKLLTLYSKPEFDPNAMSGRLDQVAWTKLQGHADAPARFVHRAVKGYSPAGLYTLVTALAGLETKAIAAKTPLDCTGAVDSGNRRFHCHRRSGHGTVPLVDALARGCNAYFYQLGQRMTLEQVAPVAAMLGLGRPTGLRLGEHTGVIPDSLKWYARRTRFGAQPGFRLSQAIGHGYVRTTPVQIARAVSAMVNGGTLPTTHLVDRIAGRPAVVAPGTPLKVAPSSLRWLRNGMEAAVRGDGVAAAVGSAARAHVAGLTGLAEVPRGHRYGQRRTWRHQDHAWFAGYAPKDDPQVVVVVFVEHGKTTEASMRAAGTFLDAWDKQQR